jgi:uncharacterized protein
MDSTITEHPNAALVRRGYAAFEAADIGALSELFHPNIVWHTPGRSPLAGDYAGQEAIFGHFARYGEETMGTFKADLKRVLTDDSGRGIGIHQNTATRNGKKLDVYCAITFEIEDGRVTDGREYFDDLYAWDEFWSG